jgi:hypothetical protein
MRLLDKLPVVDPGHRPVWFQAVPALPHEHVRGSHPPLSPSGVNGLVT